MKLHESLEKWTKSLSNLALLHYYDMYREVFASLQDKDHLLQGELKIGRLVTAKYFACRDEVLRRMKNA